MPKKESSQTTEIKDLVLSHWIFKLLGAALGTVLVPLLGWGMYLQVTVNNLENKMESYQDLKEKFEKLDETSRSNETSLATIREKVGNVEKTVEKILGEVSKIANPK